MRYIFLVFSTIFILTSCGKTQTPDISNNPTAGTGEIFSHNTGSTDKSDTHSDTGSNLDGDNIVSDTEKEREDSDGINEGNQEKTQEPLEEDALKEIEDMIDTLTQEIEAENTQ